MLRKSKKVIIVIFAILLLAVIFILNGCPRSNRYLSDSELFKKFILDPIPKSVADLRIYRPQSYLEPVYVMSFKISSDDIQTILKAKPFVLYSKWEFDIRSGVLRWTYPRDDGRRGTYMDIISLERDKNGHIKPDWFRPDQWYKVRFYAYKIIKKPDNPNIYANHVLIYDEELSEAYYVRGATGGL